MRLLLLSLLLMSGAANSVVWTSAIPKEIHLTNDGLVLIGDFDNSDVTCATGASAILLPSGDTQFDRKLSLALTAKATGKKIQVLINDPLDNACTSISAHGDVPEAYSYYWRLLE